MIAQTNGLSTDVALRNTELKQSRDSAAEQAMTSVGRLAQRRHISVNSPDRTRCPALFCQAAQGLAVLMMVCVAAAASGCGSGKESAGATAHGTVTVNGTPLQSGLVQLTPEGGTGRPAFGTIQSDGTFKVATTAGIDGVEPGTYQVAVQYEFDEDAGESLPFDEKYTDPSRSGITVDIKKDEASELKIELTAAAK